MLYQSNLPQISIEQFHQMFKEGNGLFTSKVYVTRHAARYLPDCIGTIIYNSI